MTFNPTNPTDAPDFSGAPGIGTGVVFFNNALVVPIGGMQVGPWYVGNAGAIYFATNVNTPTSAIEVTQSVDSALGQVIEQRIWNMAAGIETDDLIPVLAPWATVTLSNASGLAQNGFLYVAVLPSVATSSGFFKGTVLVNKQAQAIGASATVTVPFPLNVSGKAHLWGAMSGAGSSIAVQALNAGGTWDTVAQGTPDSNGQVNLDVDLPQSNCRAQVHNGAAVAGTYWVYVVKD